MIACKDPPGIGPAFIFRASPGSDRAQSNQGPPATETVDHEGGPLRKVGLSQMAQRNLDGMSIDELQREIKRRERHLSTLERKRAKLMDQLAEVEQQIAEQGGALAASQGRKRPRNEQNLADALVDLLSDQTLNVTSIAEEVQRAGYRTSSPNFRTIVNQTLIKDKRFKRVGRGLYTAGSASGGGKKRTSKKKRTTKRTSRK